MEKGCWIGVRVFIIGLEGEYGRLDDFFG